MSSVDFRLSNVLVCQVQKKKQLQTWQRFATLLPHMIIDVGQD
jgi:hypothetical protein